MCYFMSGSTVKILSAQNYAYRANDSKFKHERNLVGSVGVVERVCQDYVAVRVNHLSNRTAKNGRYYFKPDELELVTNDIGGNIMFDNAINFVEGTDMTEPYCGGSFVYANYDRCVEVGDLVVVENSGIGGKHLRVVKVAALIEKSNAVDDRQPVPVYGEVVAVVDASAYEDRVNNRAKLIETRKKMEERAKRLQDVAIYKMLASEDPEMEGLWKEFVALGGAK